MPKGIATLIRKTAPGKLVRGKDFTCYRALGPTGKATGGRLRGVARRLGECVFSSFDVPFHASPTWKGSHWRGSDGGRRRGSAVDTQVSRLAKESAATRTRAPQLKLTRIVFDSLRFHGLAPVEGQRVVVDTALGLGTAVDVVCTRGDASVVLVELKCGFVGDRNDPVVDARGKRVKMRAPLGTAVDSALHRHLAQLAATYELFVSEKGTVAALRAKGFSEIEGALLYVDDLGSELHVLPDWWKRRGRRLLAAIA